MGSREEATDLACAARMRVRPPVMVLVSPEVSQQCAERRACFSEELSIENWVPAPCVLPGNSSGHHERSIQSDSQGEALQPSDSWLRNSKGHKLAMAPMKDAKRPWIRISYPQ